MNRVVILACLAAASAACPSGRPQGVASIALASVAYAQSARPGPVDRLMGSWRGSGVVLGRASSITMTWEAAVGDAFVRLRFRNEMAAGAGQPATVLEAHGYYRVGGGPMNGRGTWIDSRGVVLPVAIAMSGDTLTSDWGDERTEVGRTVYRLTGPDTLEVVDAVRTPGGLYREFGRATLGRDRQSP